jgi:hypothetical protein
MFKRHAVLVPLAAALALAITSIAFAGNGAGSNKSSSSSISAPVVVSLATVSAATASVSGPHYRDVVTFNVSTTETANPYVNLKCYQNGALVGEGWATFFAGGTAGTFGLYSGPWSGGAADCTADLGMFSSNNKWKVLASTSFHVDA